MHFTTLRIPGACLIEPDRITDERGFFARLWCERELAEHGLDPTLRQTNVGVSHRRGTLRGLHLQSPPHAEAKLVRCPRGAIHDVIVDLRPDSPTWREWQAVELNQDNQRALYVPPGCAQGYMTLTDDTEVYYHTSAFYAPEAAWGVRWNDPAFGIHWPMSPTAISDADRDRPDYVVMQAVHTESAS
jgi:dTDP-4-dehydrorhamnose 3,5-epimerase